MMYTRRLRLEGMYNTRDLGGYAVPGGRTKYGVFLRSERPNNLSENDARALRDYGVTMCLDFRSEVERGREPSDYENFDWVEYRHIPTYTPDGFNTGLDRYWVSDLTHGRFPWVYAYNYIIDGGQDWIRRCLEAAAECEGVLQFHCTTGKDRTGVFAAILLTIAGVEKWDVVADYCVSQCLLDRMYAKTMSSRGYSMDDREASMDVPFFQTSHINMFGMLEHIENDLGGMYRYLTEDCGVSAGTIERIRDKFIEKF